MVSLFGRAYIVPTPVGVNRDCVVTAREEGNCPHARGGEPLTICCSCAMSELSPRPWG